MELMLTANSEPATTSALPPDVLKMLLEDKRSVNTRRAYSYDIRSFFEAVYGSEPTQALMRQFLANTTPQMATCLLRFKARLISEGRSEATINRRLSAVLSLIKFARRIGATEADPAEHVDGERVVSYRDTRGITADDARRLLRQPNRSTFKGKRDYALLLLLLENALRRAEVCALCVADFDAQRKSLSIVGKGRGTQKEQITLSQACTSAIIDFRAGCAETGDAHAPLFTNLSPACYGRALSADGLYKIVREIAETAGLSSRLSPHRLRHTAITLALDAAGGDIRRVQRLSRHARLETLQIYDDNRADLQGEVTRLLSSILSADDSKASDQGI